MSEPIEDRLQPASDLDAVQNRATLYGMDETKLTIRIERATLERAKRYAQEHGTSLRAW